MAGFHMFIGLGSNWNHPVVKAKQGYINHKTQRRRARHFVRLGWKIRVGHMEAKHARQKARAEVRLSRYRGLGA